MINIYLREDSYTAWENEFFRLTVSYDERSKLTTVNMKSNKGNKNNNLFTVVFSEVGHIASPKYVFQLDSINEILRYYNRRLIQTVITIKEVFEEVLDPITREVFNQVSYRVYKNGVYFRNFNLAELSPILQYCIVEKEV